MKRLALLAMALMTLTSVRADGKAVKTETLTYPCDGTVLQGFLAVPEKAEGKRPGILVIHEWWGHNQHARNQAVRLGEAGYAAFALDLYGKDKIADHPKDAQAFMEHVIKTPGLLSQRFQAALSLLKARPEVDPTRIGVLGYCFGGTVALGMARAGEDLQAVVTFHAGLTPPDAPAAPGHVKARILVHTGGKDPMIPAEQVMAFETEMKAAKADARVVVYPEAVHSFTNPDAGKAGMEALRYDAEADRKSWEATVAFLQAALK